MATLKDVAQMAGVSIKTVSRVINNEPNVAEATKSKVVAAIDHLGFRPNISARVMRTGKSDLVGIITHQALRRPWSSDIMEGLFQGLEQSGKRPLITQIPNYEHMDKAILMLKDQAVEGIIYVAMYHHGIHLPKSAYDIPFIVCNSYDKKQKVMSVVPDDYFGSTLATKHLIDKGYTKIAYLGLSKDVDAGVLRAQAFKDCLKKAKIELNKEHFQYGEVFVNQKELNELKVTVYEKLQSWSNNNNMPQAVVVGNDQMAMVVMEFAQRNQLSIPKDLAIVGYDNHIPIAQFVYPKLTTIDIAYYDVGYLSACRLLEATKEQSSQKDNNISNVLPHLVTRQST